MGVFFARQRPGFQPRNALSVSIGSLMLLSVKSLRTKSSVENETKKMDPNIGLGCPKQVSSLRH